jgi:hypothetical protein
MRLIVFIAINTGHQSCDQHLSGCTLPIAWGGSDDGKKRVVVTPDMNISDGIEGGRGRRGEPHRERLTIYGRKDGKHKILSIALCHLFIDFLPLQVSERCNKTANLMRLTI